MGADDLSNPFFIFLYKEEDYKLVDTLYIRSSHLSIPTVLIFLKKFNCVTTALQSHAGKVVERHWYEKNKHIFPASRWEVTSLFLFSFALVFFLFTGWQ